MRYPGSHSSGPAVACRLERPTREQREPRYRPPIWSCSGWGLPCRFCCQKRGGLLPYSLATDTLLAERTPFHHRLIRRPSRYKSETLRPCGRKLGCRPSADCSLWHFPSPHGVRPLTGILLCGARTFLCASELCSDCPASFGTDYRIGKPGSPDFGSGMTLIGQNPAKSQPTPQQRSIRRPGASCAMLSSAQANCAATAATPSLFYNSAQE